MALTPINNGDTGLSARTTLNQLIALAGTTYPFSGGSVLFADAPTTTTTTRQVATRCYFLDSITAGAASYNTQTYHHARDNITSLRVAWCGFYLDGACVETANTGTNTLSAAIWYDGIAYPLLFSASSSATIPNGGILTSDLLTVSIPRGAKFYVRSYVVASAAVVCRAPGTAAAATTRDVLNGDAVNFTATNQTQLMSGVPDAGTNASGLWPSLIVASSNRPAVLLVGDSRVLGLGDDYTDGFGYVGDLERSIAPFLAETNIGRGADYTGGFLARVQTLNIFTYFTHAVIEYGINEISGGTSAASMITNLQAVYAKFTGGQIIFQTTLEPSSTSTDSFATIANQTTHANNANRVSLNTSIRATLANTAGYFDLAAAVESSLNSGKWKAPGYTPDGVHASKVGNEAIANSDVVTIGSFFSSPAFAQDPASFYYSPSSRTLHAESLHTDNLILAKNELSLERLYTDEILFDATLKFGASSQMLLAQDSTVTLSSITALIKAGSSTLIYMDNPNANYNVFMANGGNLTATAAGASFNVAIGSYAGVNFTNGSGNILLGAFAGYGITGGNGNACIGVNAGAALSTANQNFAFGQESLKVATTSSGNVGIGSFTLRAITTGPSNTALGWSALTAIAGAATLNTAIGSSAGYNITSGNYNTLIGCWLGPAGALNSVIAFSDGAGNVRLDYGYTNASVWSFSSNIVLRPPASATPAVNGDLTFQATSNTSLAFKFKGSDGTVRTGSITLA